MPAGPAALTPMMWLMTLTINGEAQTVPEPCTVEGLLAHLGLSAAPCAVEVNAHLVPRRGHAGRLLSEGDSIEIVTLVGGG